MKGYLSLAGSLALAVLMTGCAKVTNDQGRETDDKINFDLSYVATKSQISSSEFLTNGTSVKVYDILTFSQDKETYLDDVIKYNSTTSKWVLDKGKEYAWTRTGTHKFFGWLTNDAYGSLTPTSIWSNPAISYSGEEQKLTIPEKALDFTTTAQFDMLYSDIVIRTMNNSKYDDHSPVQLKMQHLFSAISFGINNQLAESVTIKEIKLQGIHNTGSATINFSGVNTQVNYSAFTGSLGKTWSSTSGVVVPQKTKIADAFNPTATKRDIRMMWPLKWNGDLNPGALGSDWGYNESGKLIDNTTSALIYVRYISKGEEHYVPISLTEGLDWNPGVSIHYDIVFAEKQMYVTATTNPWEYVENVIDYESETVSVSKGLEVDRDFGHCSVVGTDVTFTDGLFVRSNFTLSTPIGGSWIVELSGENAEAFELYEKTDLGPASVVGGAVGAKAEFYIRPKTSSLPSGIYKTKIKVTVKTASGRFVNADNVVQAGENALTYIYINK